MKTAFISILYDEKKNNTLADYRGVQIAVHVNGKPMPKAIKVFFTGDPVVDWRNAIDHLPVINPVRAATLSSTC
jgi:hypothetical protein